MENRVLQTELIAWQELNDLQPKGLKIDTNTTALKTSLQKHGFSLPFYGWRDAKGKIWIIDGHTRKTVLKELISEGVEVPELLPCTFIDAKDKKEAVKLLLEVYNQKQNKIDSIILEVFVSDLNIDLEEIAVESILIERVYVSNQNKDEEDFFNTKNDPNDNAKNDSQEDIPNTKNLGSHDNYSNFELVMLYENKVLLMETIKKVKERLLIEKIEDALMEIIRQFNNI